MEVGFHLVALLLPLVENVQPVVPEHHPLVVQVLVLDWEGPASVVEVPGSVTDYETLVLASVVVLDLTFGVEVPDSEFDGVLDLAFEDFEPEWDLLVFVGVPAATVLVLALVSEDPELEAPGSGWWRAMHLSRYWHHGTWHCTPRKTMHCTWWYASWNLSLRYLRERRACWDLPLSRWPLYIGYRVQSWIVSIVGNYSTCS